MESNSSKQNYEVNGISNSESLRIKEAFLTMATDIWKGNKVEKLISKSKLKNIKVGLPDPNQKRRLLHEQDFNNTQDSHLSNFQIFLQEEEMSIEPSTTRPVQDALCGCGTGPITPTNIEEYISWA